MKPYRIILADDHQLMREAVCNLINACEELRVVGEAGDGLELIDLLKRVAADLVIMDIAMPGLRGIEAAQEIRARYPKMRLLFLSMHKSEDFVSQALSAGATGYLLKEDSGTELLKAIEFIRDGRTYLSSRLAATLSRNIIGILRGDHKSRIDPLTPRERQVLMLIAEGRTDREIGELLFISLRTAQRHHYNIRSKLNLRCTADLVKYAIAKGYTTDNS
jgi:two-component system, NarL family, response regulator NreC